MYCDDCEKGPSTIVLFENPFALIHSFSNRYYSNTHLNVSLRNQIFLLLEKIEWFSNQ